MGQIWLSEERMCVLDSNSTAGANGYENPTIVYDETSESIQIQVGAEFVTIETENIFNFETTITKVFFGNFFLCKNFDPFLS